MSDTGASPTDFNDCVSKGELTSFITEQRKFNDEQRHLMAELTRNMNNLVTRIAQVEQRPPPERPPPERRPPPGGDADLGEDNFEDGFGDDEFDDDAQNRRRFNFNRRGMGGNNGNNDPFSKVKFSLPEFAGNVDPEAYLDWELAVQQKFDSHRVPEEHRVRLATSEFTKFALFWWSDLCNANNAAAVPQTWNELKHRMKTRFVPPYYQRDLRLKLQTLKQGDRGVEEYYQELLMGLARCDIHEDDADASARFFGGLNAEIQSILDYKTWRNFSALYHLAIKAEREVQCRRHEEQSFRNSTGRSYQPRSNFEKNKASVSTPPPAPPSSTQSSEVSKLSSVQPQPSKKGVVGPTHASSSGSTSKIICHRCKGMGHKMVDCPSKRAYIATVDGYESASDVEDELVLSANLAADLEEVHIDSLDATKDYPSLLVQRALSLRVGHDEEMQQLGEFRFGREAWFDHTATFISL
jgi:hypothetical protein